jgi:hypothetical protein
MLVTGRRVAALLIGDSISVFKTPLATNCCLTAVRNSFVDRDDHCKIAFKLPTRQICLAASLTESSDVDAQNRFLKCGLSFKTAHVYLPYYCVALHHA